MNFENCWCQGLVLSLCSPTISLIIRKIRKMLMFHEDLCAFWRHGTNLGSLPHPLQVSFWTLCLSLTPDLIPKGHWHVTNKNKYDFFLFVLFVTHFVISSPLAKRQKRSRRPLASSSSEPLAKKTSTLTLVCYQTCSPIISCWIQMDSISGLCESQFCFLPGFPPPVHTRLAPPPCYRHISGDTTWGFPLNVTKTPCCWPVSIAFAWNKEGGGGKVRVKAVCFFAWLWLDWPPRTEKSKTLTHSNSPFSCVFKRGIYKLHNFQFCIFTSSKFLKMSSR